MWTSLLLASALIVLGDDPKPQVSHTTAPKGHLVIIGGGTIPQEVRLRALTLAGGPQSHVALIGNASSNPQPVLQETANRFRELGATHVEVVDLTQTEPATSSLLKADLIWFIGGDQNRLTTIMLGTPIPDAIRRRYAEGATIAGTSAGASVMSGLMLSGGSDLDTIRNGTTQVVGGLGLWNEAIVDQHFLKRGRFNRLAGAVLDHPELLGIGIDESTAVVVSGRQFEVAGQSNVIVVDARQATRSGKTKAQTGEPAAGTNLSLHVLKAGMKYHMDKGAIPASISSQTAQGGGGQ